MMDEKLVFVTRPAAPCPCPRDKHTRMVASKQTDQRMRPSDLHDGNRADKRRRLPSPQVRA